MTNVDNVVGFLGQLPTDCLSSCMRDNHSHVVQEFEL